MLPVLIPMFVFTCLVLLLASAVLGARRRLARALGRAARLVRALGAGRRL